jgi:hypothetical protein
MRRSMSPQGGPGIRGPVRGTPGSSIDVEVGPNDAAVEVVDPGGTITTHPVQPGKTAPIPVPRVPGGTILFFRVGKGPSRRVIVVEVVEMGP